ncbi:hypothetical protein CPB83DRAFT_904593 [Crepidotus variabilis]|uniref:F-box domain-containing protein n=1 Tax=Crepidotus variabilis TaxID=179855 RepID=A0A9P6EM80_9AGAR|nr:hypothetical protein CPB83DRAFT_904593 [Crepidotus variabilis]
MAFASLQHLPTELLLEIFRHLDDSSLYELGQTCKDLHYPAFSAFFKQNDIPTPSSSGWYWTSKYPPHTLSIVHSALWMKDMRHVCCSVNGGFNRIFEDTEDLHRLIGRMNFVDSFRVNLSLVDYWSYANRQQGLYRLAWGKRFTSLLDFAIERGCIDLEISGGAALKNIYVHDEPPGLPQVQVGSSQNRVEQDGISSSPISASAILDAQVIQPEISLPPRIQGDGASLKKSRSPLVNMVSRIFRRSRPPANPSSPTPILPVIIPINQIPNAESDIDPPSAPTLRLKSVDIHSPMLLQYTFYPWTINMLAKGSSTITRLSLSCVEIPTETWTHLLSSISLPLLTRIRLKTSLFRASQAASCTPKFNDILQFLERHPTITALELEGVEKPDPPPVIKQSILPRLKTISAHSIWIGCLLDILDTHADAFPDLQSINISTEYALFDDPADYTYSYDLIDAVLEKIAHFPRSITLAVQFSFEQGMEWFDSHVALGKEKSIIGSLRCVSNVVISTRFTVRCGREEVTHLAQWFALFPSLESVKILDCLLDKDGYSLLDDTALLKSMRAGCSTLKRVETSYGSINLDTLTM